MSLINAPIAERRRWVSQVAPKLYNLQKARFGYISQGQARERKLAWQLVKLEHGQEYIQEIAKTISKFDLNDSATLTAFWKILENAETDQDFARILTYDSMHPDSQPSEITLNNDYIETASETFNMTTIQSLATRYKIAIQEGKVLSPKQLYEELLRYSAGFGSFMLWNNFQQAGLQQTDNRMVNTQSVACSLAGLPLRHIQEIEVARSGRILKFRATGSVFLAQQEGGDDAIRIEGIMARSEIIFILYLWLIFYYGQGRVKEIENLTDMSQIYQSPILALRKRNVDITTYNKTTTKPSYEHHFTVPFVTRYVIIPNVYIETLSFEEKIEFGKDIIGYSILLRTYRKEVGFDVFHTDAPTLSFVAPKGNKDLNMYKAIEFFANFTWRFINANGIFIKEREWKIGGDEAGSDDVYYNIDTEALFTSVAMGVVGII